MKKLNKKQAGVTLIELIVAITIMSAMAVGINALINQSTEDTRASVTALHLKTVGDAANEYIKDNYAAVTAVATATAPALIRVSDLIAGGYLTTGYAVANPRNQNTCVLVLEPAANNLTALAITEGGDTIDDLTLGQIAATIGGAGGGIYSTATTTVRGAMGGYSLAVGNFANANNLTQKCNGTAGTPALAAGHPAIALWFADGNAVSAALYRDAVPGNTTLNTMNTPIIMGGGTVQAVNGACTTLGALGRDATGKVLMCDGTNWKTQGSAFWTDPVANITALNLIACNAASAWQTRIVQSPSVGTGARPYTCNGAGTWQPLAVDDSGNILIAGTATAATLSVTGNSTLAGNLTVNGNTSLGDAATDTVAVPGTATINKLAGNLEVTSTATEGTACSPNGRIARDANGLILSCQSSSWKKASGTVSITRGVILTTSGDCPVGTYMYGMTTSTSCPGYMSMSGWVCTGASTTSSFKKMCLPVNYNHLANPVFGVVTRHLTVQQVQFIQVEPVQA